MRGFIEPWFFSKDFRKIIQCEISWKTVRCEPSYFVRTDRQTDMTKLIVPFRNYTNALSKGYCMRIGALALSSSLYEPSISLLHFIWGFVLCLPCTGLVSNLDEHCTTGISLLKVFSVVNTFSWHWLRAVAQLTHWGREGSFKLFKRPLPGFLTILTL